MRKIKIHLCLFFYLMPLSLFAQSFSDPANKLVVTSSPSIKFTSTNGLFSYEYVIKNIAGPEDMVELKLEACDGNITNIHGPQNLNWTDGFEMAPSINFRPQNFCGHFVFWTTNDALVDISQVKNLPPSVLKPGRSIQVGFTSQGLPTIKRFWGEGWVPKATEDELLGFYNQVSGKNFTTLDEIPQNIISMWEGSKPWFVNAFEGQTVVPDDPSTSQLNPSTLIQRLITLKEQATSLGWIDNAGVANSLDQKLRNALDDLNNGNSSAASGILNALLNDLEAQHGKHINDNAFSLLKANVEFILTKLH